MLAVSFSLQTVLHYVLRKEARGGAVALDSHRSVDEEGTASTGLRRYTNFEKIQATEMNYRKCFEVLTEGAEDDSACLRDSDSRYARQIRQVNYLILIYLGIREEITRIPRFFCLEFQPNQYVV